MASIEQCKDKMTLFYSKKTGKVVGVCYGIQNLSYYGENKEDYEIIYDYTVIDKDEFVFDNFRDFYINENREVKLLQTDKLEKYR